MTEDEERSAYCAQSVILRLKPWQTPPCYADAVMPPSEHDRKIYLLLQKMLRLGVSRWHHDPIAAVIEVKRK